LGYVLIHEDSELEELFSHHKFRSDHSLADCFAIALERKLGAPCSSRGRSGMVVRSEGKRPM
jgi:hypothetical protein